MKMESRFGFVLKMLKVRNLAVISLNLADRPSASGTPAPTEDERDFFDFAATVVPRKKRQAEEDDDCEGERRCATERICVSCKREAFWTSRFSGDD